MTEKIDPNWFKQNQQKAKIVNPIRSPVQVVNSFLIMFWSVAFLNFLFKLIVNIDYNDGFLILVSALLWLSGLFFRLRFVGTLYKLLREKNHILRSLFISLVCYVPVLGEVIYFFGYNSFLNFEVPHKVSPTISPEKYPGVDKIVAIKPSHQILQIPIAFIGVFFLNLYFLYFNVKYQWSVKDIISFIYLGFIIPAFLIVLYFFKENKLKLKWSCILWSFINCLIWLERRELFDTFDFEILNKTWLFVLFVGGPWLFYLIKKDFSGFKK